MPDKKTAYIVSDWLKYLTHAEIDCIKENVRKIKHEGVAVNIGAGGGTSTLSIAEARNDITIFSVDFDTVRLQGEETVLREAELWNDRRIFQILGDSRMVGENWPAMCKRGIHRESKIDFLFVDDGHLEHEIRGDIEKWLPNVEIGGIIAFHDYGAKEWPAVKQVVDELMAEHELIGRADSVIVFRKK